MKRHLKPLLLLILGAPIPVVACSCRATKPACAYLAADAIFLGRVSFTNDDGSGRFAQATVVRFDVEERFKGVAPEVSQIWVNPGSFTSCYRNYRIGKRYLMFATRTARTPNDSATVTIMRDSDGKPKPLPPGFDATKPPPVYYAPECAGSRTADYPSLDSDIAMLRAYRAGATLPRVLGNVYLYPFRGWPELTGPALTSARVTMSSDASVLHATTDEKGAFSLSDAKAGYYNARAELQPYRMAGRAVLHVPEIGCGYTDIQLTTTTTLQGIVLDHKGNPAPKIPVDVWLREKKLEDATDAYALYATTDKSGQFAVIGLPDADFYVSAGSRFPTTGTPYGRVYYPGSGSSSSARVLRLKPGERHPPIVLSLQQPLVRTAVNVRVEKDARLVPNARVNAFDENGVVAESAKTDERGVALVPCLDGLKYQLEAQTLHSSIPWRGNILKSARLAFTCDGRRTTETLVLDHSAPY